jgi:dipeptidyl aminopeptidase/acylaminoacyl peptidase
MSAAKLASDSTTGDFQPMHRFAAPLAAVLLLSGLAVSTAEAQLRPMTSEDVARLSWVDDAAISPDGRSVAYVQVVQRTPFDDEDGPAWQELHVMGPDGASRPFVTGDVRVGGVSWTRDGAEIAFTARREGDDETGLYLISTAGGEARRVLSHASGVSTYAFSADGSEVAFLAEDEGDGVLDQLAESGFDAVVVEEEDLDGWLWIARRSEDGDDGTYGDARRIEVDGHVEDLDWCGDRLALAVAPTSRIDDVYMQTRLRVLNTDGETVAQIANPGKLGEIGWSPDCAKLAFISGETINDPSEGRLMVADAATGRTTDLMPDYPGHVLDFAWSGAGEGGAGELVVLGDEGVESVLYSVSASGGEPTVLRSAGGGVFEALTLSDDGSRLAMLGESASHPTEVFVAEVGDLGSGSVELRRATTSNPWLAEIDFGRQEAITFEARDGLELEAILIHPVGRSGDTRVPLVVYVHGGPEAHDRNGWLTAYSRPGQVAAGQGMAVVYVNYRGSTGRGVEFSMLSQGRPAREEFDDLVDAVDHLVETGLVDRDRVGITGGSYGGYASAWGATYYSERFAAAVMMVGISNKISKINTSDIPEELYLVHERKRLWDDWRHFLEASPVYHVEKARTPLLIMHGDSDTRVHPSQSLELYRAIKTATDTPVRLVFFPGEGHGNRRSASRYDYNLRMLRWFEHYLMGPGGDKPPARLDYPLRSTTEEEAP